ncbi:hypothetical protein [Peribacillus butanolivorans]|jgi:hypothetical protein|nr:hypothetical protein [Peribacillus butanolivorans]
MKPRENVYIDEMTTHEDPVDIGGILFLVELNQLIVSQHFSMKT